MRARVMTGGALLLGLALLPAHGACARRRRPVSPVIVTVAAGRQRAVQDHPGSGDVGAVGESGGTGRHPHQARHLPGTRLHPAREAVLPPRRRRRRDHHHQLQSAREHGRARRQAHRDVPHADRHRGRGRLRGGAPHVRERRRPGRPGAGDPASTRTGPSSASAASSAGRTRSSSTAAGCTSTAATSPGTWTSSSARPRRTSTTAGSTCCRDGYITAASTQTDQPYGFVFRRARITGRAGREGLPRPAVARLLGHGVPRLGDVGGGAARRAGRTGTCRRARRRRATGSSGSAGDGRRARGARAVGEAAVRSRGAGADAGSRARRPDGWNPVR